MDNVEIDDLVDWKKLSNLSKMGGYKTAEPFPHIVIDDLFGAEFLGKILLEWPLWSGAHEMHNDGLYVKSKIGSNFETRLPILSEIFLNKLMSPKFLVALEELTGIGGLIPDPYNFGGGFHETKNGGKLAIHADYNKHFKYKLDRRLNLLIYLNKEWTSEMQGDLELWDSDIKHCVKKISPIFNRTVIFSTTSTSFHGQPIEVCCPAEMSRKSVALYYYSNGRPEEPNASNIEHSTLWKTRPDGSY